MKKNRLTAILLLIIATAGCSKIQETVMERIVKDRSNKSLLASDGNIRIVLCGTGTPQANSSRGQACTLVAAGGELFLFDAGENAMRNIETSNVPLENISNTFITHWHSDHFSGLDGLISHTWVNGRKKPFTVYGPTGVNNVVTGFNLAYSQDTNFRSKHFVPNPSLAFAKATQIELGEGQSFKRVYNNGGITIDAYKVDHRPVEPAFGYLLSYNGKKVFISGDTRVTDLYMDAIKNADMVVHEAINSHMVHQAADAFLRTGHPKKAGHARKVIEYHSDTLELARLAQKAKVKNLVLTHLIPSPSNFITRHLFTRGMNDSFDGQIILAEDGMTLEI